MGIMTSLIDLTSDIAIATGGMLAGMLIYAFFHEEKITEWERKHIFAPLRRLWRRISRFIRSRLKSNARFMTWLNKPQKHGKPDEEWITGQIKVFGDFELTVNIR